MQDPYQYGQTATRRATSLTSPDIVHAFLRANERTTVVTSVNAGISEYISINEVTETIFEYMDWQPKEIDRLTYKPVVVRYRAADTKRAQNLLDWSPGKP
jgi:UDP-glucose 4-epimerase